MPAPPDLPWFQWPVEFKRGVPVVDDLRCDTIEHDGLPYMRRYYLHRSRDLSVRLHHLLADDGARALHDHPWDFVSLLLTGAYRETTPELVVEYRAPCLVPRRAEQLHRLELLDGPMWTYVTTGPVRRGWGFVIDGRWVPWRDYADAGELLPDFC